MQALCPAPPLTTKQASNSSTDQGGGKRRRCFADPNPRFICEAPFMDEAVVLVPEMWAAFPAIARTAALAWAFAPGQPGAAAEALASS